MVLVQQVLLEDLEGSNVHTGEGDDAQLHTHTHRLSDAMSARSLHPL